MTRTAVVAAWLAMTLAGITPAAGQDVAATPPSPTARRTEMDSVVLGDDLAVRPLRDGFWLHVSTAELGSSNGLLARLPGGEVLLVDTPCSHLRTVG
jgi:hypothetical protein